MKLEIFKKKEKKAAAANDEEDHPVVGGDDEVTEEANKDIEQIKNVEKEQEKAISLEEIRIKEEEMINKEEQTRIDNRLREAKTEVGLGKINITSNKLAEAHDNFEFAYQIYQDLLGENPEDEKAIKRYRKLSADCHGKLGEVHLIMGDFDPAKQYLKQAQSTYKTYEPEFEMDYYLIGKLLGDAYFMAGEDAEAKAAYSEVVNVLEKDEFLGWSSSKIGDIYKCMAELNLSKLCLDDEKWNETLKYYRNAVASKQNAEDVSVYTRPLNIISMFDFM